MSRNIVSMTTLSDPTPDSYWSLYDLADVLGVTYNSARTYHGRAEINRRRENPRPGDLPPPDRRFGRSPVWKPETIQSWLPMRPGRGAGGGRPRENDQ